MACDKYSLMKIENLFTDLPIDRSQETFENLLEQPNLRLERIVSFGQATPTGEWYDQDRDEWLVMLKGKAGLLFEGETDVRVLEPGDYLLIPAHCRHRVEWTAEGEATVWLALHYS